MHSFLNGCSPSIIETSLYFILLTAFQYVTVDIETFTAEELSVSVVLLMNVEKN